MRNRAIAIAIGAVSVALLAAATAEARNPNCAGGIQYVVQGMRDKEKGNLEDYKREMSKAVDRLTQCATEDPADLEALAYLGWAYAEIDSAGPAGAAFQKAIDGLKAKGDKKADWASQNRDSYWAKYFNAGIASIQAGQAAWPDFSQEPKDDTQKKLLEEAKSKYDAAIVALTRAEFLKPGDPKTMRNLGTVYAYEGDYLGAANVFRQGLKSAPGDSDLVSSIKLVTTNYANKLIDEKKFDEALGFYTDLIKDSPNNPDLHLGMADAYFKRAFSKEGDARKADYKSAGAEYGKASDLKGGDADLLFNSALAYQNAGDFPSAETQWKAYLKIKPDETEALSAYGATLAELGKYDEALAALFHAVSLKPKEKTLHRQYGGVFAKAGDQERSYGEMVVYIALEKGTAAPDAKAAAEKSASGRDSGKTLKEMGAPEEVRYWDAEGQQYETWLYWAKNMGFTFRGGQQVAKSDWGSKPGPVKPAAPATTPGKKK